VTLESTPRQSASPQFSRRTVVKATAWSAPVIAAAIAAPALAASGGSTATLTFAVAPLVDVYAPFGTTSLLVTNTSGVEYSGPLTFSTPVWSSTAPFTVPGATMTTVGDTNVWTIADTTLPANESVSFPLTWDAPYPVSAEQHTVSATVDPARGSITPTGDETVWSPYQLLWYAVTPGGQGNSAGTPGFFIGNTTETDFASTDTTIRMGVWSFPIVQGFPITAEGATYTGARVAENGQFVFRYDDVPAAVPSGGGKLDFTFNWATPGTGPVTQQQRQLASIIPEPAATLATLGSLTIYSWSR
jgi:hypothetical protein